VGGATWKWTEIRKGYGPGVSFLVGCLFPELLVDFLLCKVKEV
jgi:hypothetical protein